MVFSLPNWTLLRQQFNHSGIVDQLLVSRSIHVPDDCTADQLNTASDQAQCPAELHTQAHYSVMYNAAWTEWASEPWVAGTDFYQTFVATEPHITRLCVRLAGKSGDHFSMTLNMGIYRVSDGPPSTWANISPVRSIFMPGNMDPIIHLLWVPYRSTNMELIPGQMYAARFWRQPGSQSANFSIVARSDRGDGYEAGQLYSGNTPLDWDAYAYISGGQSGTVVNHAPVDLQVGQTGNWSTRIGQTFQATGTSVAAAELMYITGDPTPPVLNFDFQVYDDVGGNPIGPVKKGYGVPGFYEARAAAFWREGEVPTTPGQMYYLEMVPPPSGCNVFFMRDNVPGGAYFNRVARGGEDIMGCIAEYMPAAPKIGLSPAVLTPSVEEGGNAAPDTFTVANVGAESLTYTVSEDVSWLSVSPTGGSSDGEDDPITVTYLTSELGVGFYTGVITVSSPDAFNSPQTVTVQLAIEPHPGDFDKDGDVDQNDFGYLQSCFSGAGVEQTDFDCLAAMLDDDDDVDVDDFGIFQACMSGAGVPAVYGCGE